jgi:hypothetical protein
MQCGKQGGYLDLWLMVENGRIEWKNYQKVPVYEGPNSCHDSCVMKSIVKGVGHILRINSSKDEYFEEAVEETAKAFIISGYKYQNAKKKLMEFKIEDPVEMIKKKKVARKPPEKCVNVFLL